MDGVFVCPDVPPSVEGAAAIRARDIHNPGNLIRLMDPSGPWIDTAHQHRKLTKCVLDMDSSLSENSTASSRARPLTPTY